MHVNKSKFIFYTLVTPEAFKSCEVNTDSKIYDFAIELIEIDIENTMIEEEIRTLLMA